MSNDPTGPQARLADFIARFAASTQALREDLQREAVEGPKRAAVFERGWLKHCKISATSYPKQPKS